MLSTSSSDLLKYSLKHSLLLLTLYYSAWNYFTPTVKFRTLCAQPELRYWFSCEDGFYLGLHVGVAYYNVAIGGDWRYQDKDGNCPVFDKGIGFGYRTNLSEDHRWKIEFSIGAGVNTLRYDIFHNESDGSLDSTHKETFYSIDNAAISISYCFGFKRGKK